MVEPVVTIALNRDAYQRYRSCRKHGTRVAALLISSLCYMQQSTVQWLHLDANCKLPLRYVPEVKATLTISVGGIE
ncbi:hypothetical protein M0804_009821 [Polistes exclamans]|nr:hypothetical protein M0804_009821 [Polistes exclamans]